MIKFFYLIFFIGLQLSSFSKSQLPEFIAAYNSRKKAVSIKWQSISPDVKTYVLQRSIDNKKWVDIALQESIQTTGNGSFYFEDKNFVVGQNFYRLKSLFANSKTVLSINVIVIIGSPTKSWAMYPVPVTNLLTLDYRGTETIKGVINVIIQHPDGKVFTKLRYSSLSRQIKIPVDNLPKGIYDIRIVVQDEVIWDQRFLK